MSRFRRHGLLLGLLTFLALFLTWPLITRIGTHVPGSDTWAYDEYTFIWSMWWFKHSLLDLRESIFFSQNIFYPLGMELILYSYNLLAAILALPLGVAANWPFASNITLLFSMVTSGYGAYLLTLWTFRSKEQGAGSKKTTSDLRLVAILAALIYAFASNRLIYFALGHYNIQSWQFLPFFILYILRIMDKPSRRNILLAGLFGALNLLVDMQYGVFMAFLGGCLLLSKPLRRALFRRPWEIERWAGLTVAATLALIFTWPYFWETAKSFLTGGFVITGWGDALKLSADLVGWFTPTALHPLWGADWVARLREVQEGSAPFRDINTVFLGYVTLALALVGAVAIWRKAKGWVIAAILSASFTLGPLLQIYGETIFDFDGLESSVPMPFLLLHYIPFVQGNRTANRWSIVLMLALAVLAAWGAAALVNWLKRFNAKTQRRRGAEGGSDSPPRSLALSLLLIFSLLILLEHLALPLPLTDARIPQAVQEMAAMPDGAVLQIPMGWRNSFGVLGSERTQAQYYMSAHENPILSGNTSRNPEIKFDYFARLPLVHAITRQEFGEAPSPETLAAAEAQVEDLMTLWGVRYLMILPPVEGRLPYADHWAPTQKLALDLIPRSFEPIIDDGQVQIWLVESGWPLPLNLDFGGRDTSAWRGDGWGADEPDVGGASGIWATKRSAHLMFRSEDETPHTLSFRAMPFDWPDAEPQLLILRLNGDGRGERIGQATLTPGWNEYEFEITPKVGINHLWLDFSRADSPRNVLNQAQIGSTGVQSPINIDVHSFEQAFITLIDGDGKQTDASFGRRGYNVTVIDRHSGEIISQEGFDTVANEFEVSRMVEHLNSLPQGQIAILATREGAGDFITPDLITALQRLGSSLTDPGQLSGQSHAFVGVVSSGAGAETLDPHDAFLRISGDYRTLAATLDWLKIE